MKRKEPSTCLVDTLCNIICREHFCEEFLLVFKRIMHLCIRHSPGIKPTVYQICFADHFLSGITYKEYLIDEWPVKIEMLVVLSRVIANNEFFKRILFHESCLNGLIYFYFQFACRTDAFFFFFL